MSKIRTNELRLRWMRNHVVDEKKRSWSKRRVKWSPVNRERMDRSNQFQLLTQSVQFFMLLTIPVRSWREELEEGSG